MEESSHWSRMDTAYVFLPPQQKKAGDSRLLIIHCCGVAAADVSYRLWIWEDIIQFQLRVIQKYGWCWTVFMVMIFFVDMHWLDYRDWWGIRALELTTLRAEADALISGVQEIASEVEKKGPENEMESRTRKAMLLSLKAQSSVARASAAEVRQLNGNTAKGHSESLKNCA